MTGAFITIEDSIWEKVRLYKAKHKFKNTNALMTYALTEMLKRDTSLGED